MTRILTLIRSYPYLFAGIDIFLWGMVYAYCVLMLGLSFTSPWFWIGGCVLAFIVGLCWKKLLDKRFF
jgi:hypothetical protein